MKEILEIIKTMGTNRANVNPTEIYNEGWMTRLLVYYSALEKLKIKEIDFASINYWASEALISSPFINAKKHREGYTHADIALGDFTVNFGERGKINVNLDAKQFGVIEAKMGSQLSRGTKNAPDYNQASRNVSCIAHNVAGDCKTFFYVAAPESKIDKKGRDGRTTRDLVNNEVINQQIDKRFKLHTNSNTQIENEHAVKEKAAKCIVGIITFEEWIDLFAESQIKDTLTEFYNNCKKWNRIDKIKSKK